MGACTLPHPLHRARWCWAGPAAAATARQSAGTRLCGPARCWPRRPRRPAWLPAVGQRRGGWRRVRRRVRAAAAGGLARAALLLLPAPWARARPSVGRWARRRSAAGTQTDLRRSKWTGELAAWPGRALIRSLVVAGVSSLVWRRAAGASRTAACMGARGGCNRGANRSIFFPQDRTTPARSSAQKQQQNGELSALAASAGPAAALGIGGSDTRPRTDGQGVAGQRQLTQGLRLRSVALLGLPQPSQGPPALDAICGVTDAAGQQPARRVGAPRALGRVQAELRLQADKGVDACGGEPTGRADRGGTGGAEV